MELINRDLLVGKDGLFTKQGCPGNCQYCGLWSKEGCRVILEAPTVDAVEIVHGQWIRNPIGKYTGVDEVCCSVCGCFIGVVFSDTGFKEAISGMNYCHNCGAKMDGDKDGK
jgi:hypothetical protein